MDGFFSLAAKVVHDVECGSGPDEASLYVRPGNSYSVVDPTAGQSGKKFRPLLNKKFADHKVRTYECHFHRSSKIFHWASGRFFGN